jgi:hypothetical protein
MLIHTFRKGQFSARERQVVMNEIWHDLPSKIKSLADFADKYGTLQFDEPIYKSLHELDASEIVRLKEIGLMLSDEWEAIQKYISLHPITEFESGKRLYFLLHFFAIGNDLSIL